MLGSQCAAAEAAAAVASPLDAWIGKMARRVQTFKPGLKVGSPASTKLPPRQPAAGPNAAQSSPDSRAILIASSECSSGASNDRVAPADAGGGSGDGSSSQPIDAAARGCIDSSSDATSGSGTAPIRALVASLDSSSDSGSADEPDASAAATALGNRDSSSSPPHGAAAKRFSVEGDAVGPCGTQPAGRGRLGHPVPVAHMSAALMAVLAARLGPPATRLARRAAAMLVARHWPPARGARVGPAASGDGEPEGAHGGEAARRGGVPGGGCPPSVGAAPVDDASSRAAHGTADEAGEHG
jgi:hypothetical protein